MGAPPPPPPGYAPPPPGYAYYYPPPLQPIARRKQQVLPRDAAVSASPFVDLLVTSVSWQNRFSEFLDVGLQAGVYAAGRIRLTANVILPTSALSDDFGSSYAPYSGSGDYYVPSRSKAASAIFGVGVGVVAVSSPTFLLSPGLVFSHTDVSDYGSSLAAQFPFEWVTANGLRLGFEFDAGRALGGSYRLQCTATIGGLGTGCASGSQISLDRPAGTSIVLQFQIGFGFNHPDPLSPKAGDESETYGWPAVSPAAPVLTPTAPAAAPVTPAATPSPAPAAPAAPALPPNAAPTPPPT